MSVLRPESLAAKRMPNSTPLPWRKAGAVLIVGLILWPSLLSHPRPVDPLDLSSSWEQSLAYFGKHQFQAGKDYIFSYGPLGYFDTLTYDADLFWYKYAWDVI